MMENSINAKSDKIEQLAEISKCQQSAQLLSTTSSGIAGDPRSSVEQATFKEDLIEGPEHLKSGPPGISTTCMTTGDFYEDAELHPARACVS